MRFLIDAQLPPALVRFLEKSGCEAEHVIDIDLVNADDSQIWDYAVSNTAIIVTKDEDFAARVQLNSEGPSVVWLRIGNCSTRSLLQWLAPILPRILDSLRRGEKLIEVI